MTRCKLRLHEAVSRFTGPQPVWGDRVFCFFRQKEVYFKGQLGVPLTVYLWYLLYSLEILGDYNP